MTTLLDQPQHENNEDPQDQYPTFKPRDRAIRKSDGQEFLIFTVDGDLIAGVGRHPRTGEAIELQPTHRKHFKHPEVGPKQGAPVTIKPVPVESEPAAAASSEETQPVPTIKAGTPPIDELMHAVHEAATRLTGNSAQGYTVSGEVSTTNSMKHMRDLIDEQMKAAGVEDDEFYNVPVKHEPAPANQAPISGRKKVQAKKTLNVTAEEYAQMLNDGWEVASQGWHVGALNVMWIKTVDGSEPGNGVTLAEAWLSGKYSSSELQAIAEREAEELGLPVLWAAQQSKNGQTWESLMFSRKAAEFRGM